MTGGGLFGEPLDSILAGVGAIAFIIAALIVFLRVIRAEARAALTTTRARAADRSKRCEHQWVNTNNEYIEVCPKCGCLKL